MRSASLAVSNIPIKDIQHHFNDTLIQFFYLFGIEPNTLDISEFTKEKKYLLKDFKETKLLTTFWKSSIGYRSNGIDVSLFP